MPPILSHPSSWETSSMTSLGRRGNTKIAGQPGSQPRAWTPEQTKVHNVFSMCLIINCNPLSLCFPPSFSLFHHPSLSTTLSFSLNISLSFSQTLWSWRQGHTLYSWQAAVCGAFAGAGDYLLLWERSGEGGGGKEGAEERREGWMAKSMDGRRDG